MEDAEGFGPGIEDGVSKIWLFPITAMTRDDGDPGDFGKVIDSCLILRRKEA
jgi:hypothetical protein